MTVFTSPERRVIKYIFLLSAFWGLFLKAQVSVVDLEKKSMALLKTKIAYTAQKPSLKETLKGLSFENNINILFSSTTLGETKAALVTAGQIELGTLLSMLLKGTGFDYVVVGQSIAIVENAVKSPSHDSAVAKPPVASNHYSHIVSEKTHSFEHIPKKERKRVRALLIKELNNYGLELEESQDTLIVKPIENKTNYGIALLAGYIANKVHTRSMVAYDWESELRYQQKSLPSFCLGIQGLVYKRNYFGFVGLTVHTLKTEVAWIEMKKNGAQVELPGTSKAEKVKYLSANDRFVMLSLPIGGGYNFKIHQNHTIAPMLSFDVFTAISSQNSDLSKFKDYFKVKEPQAKYSEKMHTSGLGSTLSVRYSYTPKLPYTFMVDIGYKLGLSPIMSNSIFKSSSRGLLCTIGINYGFDLP